MKIWVGLLLASRLALAEPLTCENRRNVLAGDIAPQGEFGEPEGAYKFNGTVAGTPASGFHWVDKHYLEDFQYPSDQVANSASNTAPRLVLKATRGEFEPVSFVVLAAEPLQDVEVSISNLTGPKVIDSASCSVVRRVVRNYKRIGPDVATKKLYNNWLPRWKSSFAVNIPQGEFREAYILIEVPKTAPSGKYLGSVTVSSLGKPDRVVPLELTVNSFDFVPAVKKVGTIYEAPTGGFLANASAQMLRQIKTELKDLMAHGVRVIHPMENGGFTMIAMWRDGAGKYLFDATRLASVIRILTEIGFDGDLVVDLPFWNMVYPSNAIDTRGLSARDKNGDTTMTPEFRLAFEQVLKLVATPGKFRVLAQISDEFQLYDTTGAASNRAADLIKQIRLWERAGNPRVNIYNTVALQSYSWDRYIREWGMLDLNTRVVAFPFDTALWDKKITSAQFKDLIEGTLNEAWMYTTGFGDRHDRPGWVRNIAGAYLFSSEFVGEQTWGLANKNIMTGKYYGSPFDDSDNHCSATVTKGCDGADVITYGLGYSRDPLDVMPNRQYEARREGAEDLRYLELLEATAAVAPDGPIKDAANNFLARVRAMHRFEPIPAVVGTPLCALELSPADQPISTADGFEGGGFPNSFNTLSSRVAFKKWKNGAQWDCFRNTVIDFTEKLKAVPVVAEGVERVRRG